jgi:hypothetical protein
MGPPACFAREQVVDATLFGEGILQTVNAAMLQQLQ